MKSVAFAIAVVFLIGYAQSVPVEDKNSFVASFWDLQNFNGGTVTFGAGALGKCINLEEYNWARRIVSVEPNTNCVEFFYSNDCSDIFTPVSVDSKYPYKYDLGMNFFSRAAVSFRGSLGDCVPRA